MSREIKKVAVIGAGTMGAAIAQHFCMKGLPVLLVDMNDGALERGMKLIRDNLADAKAKKVVSDEEFEKSLARLSATTDRAKLGQVDLVVEAVFEDLGVKRKLFAEIEAVVRPDCLLASNTSSFLIADIAQGLKHPERVVGVHYFYHAAKNKLVEIIAGRETDPVLARGLFNFYLSIDKIPIWVKDAPGFAVNRFFVPWLNEACRLYEEGLGSIAFIDEVARAEFGIGMGPFALMNATGVPIAQHAAEGLASKLGKDYLPAESLKAQVAARKDWDLTDSTVLRGGQNNRAAVIERLFAASLGVARQLVNEGVADATSTDLGARVGLRWPKGPFEMMREKSWKGEGVRPEHRLRWVEYETSGECAWITFNTPDRMNPLHKEVVEQLAECWTKVEADSRIKRVFFSGRGKAFVAGADIKFFVDSIENRKFDEIYTFTRDGQELLKKISHSSKTSIAYITGLTLGGGLEFALACKHRIATPKAVFGLPETGIGIFPGLGGTQRTPRLIGKGLAKFLIATGQMLNAKMALEYGLIDQVVEPVSDLRELETLKLPASQGGRSGTQYVEEAFAAFDGKLTPEVFSNKVFAQYEKQLKRKAPRALEMALTLVDQGEKLDVDAAIALELEATRKVFGMQDALSGLKSILTKSKPEFTGK